MVQSESRVGATRGCAEDARGDEPRDEARVMVGTLQALAGRPVSGAYYNEFDKFAAAWLRELIKAGAIAPGDVDERSILDVRPDDLNGYTQCHFFAGIGVWSYALRAAGWSDDEEVWTGSCPCQPFSAAGKGGGFDDERHLWPAWFHLVEVRRPVRVYGEQVASKDGLAWLDVVHTDMEAADYAFGATDLCAAGVGAPHIRQRLYFVAESQSQQLDRSRDAGPRGREFTDSSELGDANDAGSQGRSVPAAVAGRDSDSGLVARAPSATNGFWNPADWLPCVDGKARPVEPGTFPLATGAANRVGRLRGYGNAINAEVAKEFIQATLG